MYQLSVVDPQGYMTYQMFSDRQAAEDEAISQLKAGAVLVRLWYQEHVVMSLTQAQLPQFTEKETDNG